MVGTSKILTVSYGTFSCTLEGFDDPFAAMKSIAEYFRDLAAEDRYFGAEPPQPDAEMLHRIAEKEVQRRVEARVGENGVTLRQIAEAEEAASATVGAPAPDMPEDVDAAPQEDAVPEVVEDEEPLPEVAEAEEPTPDSAYEAAPEEPEIAEEPVAITAEEDAETQETAEAESPAPQPEAEAEEEFEDIEFETAIAAQEAPEPAVAPEPEQVPEPVAAASAPDSVADKLSRIRAVVQRARETAPIARGEPDDEDFAAEATPEPAPQPEPAATRARRVESMIAGALAAERASLTAEAEADAPLENETTEDASWDEPLRAEADAPEHAEADAADETATEEATAHADDSDEDHGVAPAAESRDEPVAAGDDAEGDEAEDPRLIAERIVRLKEASERTRILESSADAPAQDDEAEPEERRARRRVLIGDGPEGAPGFDRILRETNSKMAESEGTRRRSAIAHLKAAVAATKADRLLKRERSEGGDAEEQSAYREDLAKVVRPRPSEPRENAADREAEKSAGAGPAADTDSPLVLVSSQRIDGGAAGPRDGDEDAVRPRRIGAGMLALDTDDDDDGDSEFVAFARQMGAQELPDVLEAAAAYTAFVEGFEHFSRPQIMRRAAAMETDEEFTREAGLRSFGQLLRQGRIRKLQRGQFTIPETTRFNPEARIAGE